MAAIMVLTAGSTGDVEPFAALAGHLAVRGHSVTLAADVGFEPLAPGGGVEFAPIRADFQSLLPTPERKKPSLRNDVFPVIRGMLEDSLSVAQSMKPRVIVAHDKTLAAPHLAEKLGIPHVRALTVPMLTPTREFPLPAMVHHNLGGLLNRASYRLVGLLSRPYSGLIRDWRDSLGLAGRGKPPAPTKTLYCYSPSLVPTPADWPRDTVATGYWLRDLADGTDPLDAELEGFVADGAQPVYVGFGSSVGPDPDHLGAVVGDAVREAGVRALIATGWGGLSGVQNDSGVMVVESVPHRWLFPRVAAVVHHGGAGTTAAGLLAGRPSIICPFRATSIFGARRCIAPGSGPRRCRPRSSTRPLSLLRSARRSTTLPFEPARPRCRSGSRPRTVLGGLPS